MSYLELLNLTREPFSNSPDPDAYYRTPTHEACLHRLEIAIRLRRGLNVVLGEVGTGKSTLCRCLLRALGGEERMDVFLLLDPGFEDADAFVRHLCELLTGQRPPEETARRDCVSLIQNRVFDRALNEGRNLVLFIDEGQKLAPAALAGEGGSLMVTPRDIDQRVSDMAKVIGFGINLALQSGLTVEDVELFLS